MLSTPTRAPMASTKGGPVEVPMLPLESVPRAKITVMVLQAVLEECKHLDREIEDVGIWSIFGA